MVLMNCNLCFIFFVFCNFLIFVFLADNADLKTNKQTNNIHRYFHMILKDIKKTFI